LWNIATEAALHELEGHSESVLLVLFSPDGRLLASCSTDATVRLWDPATGTPFGTLSGHSAAVINIAFSLDSRYIASCSVDTTVLV
jgi:WD40 repeat protein